MKTGISTHILDLSTGLPAPDVRVVLLRVGDEEPVGQARTDADGRASLLDGAPAPGNYRLEFEVAPYFAAERRPTFFPVVVVVFSVPDPARAHYHVPLLLSPFGYSTYRGS